MIPQKKFIGFFANFSEEHTKKIKRAYMILRKVLEETRHNNRDTQMLGRIIIKLNWIVEQQYEEIEE